MAKLLNSVFAANISQFIDLKKTLGYKYRIGSIILHQIDELAEVLEIPGPGINKVLADQWSITRPAESSKYRYERVRILAEFSAFLSDIGIISFIPKIPQYSVGDFVPYIYSNREIDALFTAGDQIRLSQFRRSICAMCIPALLRLLYSTGIRIGEACNLHYDDVQIHLKYLKIRDSKNGSERIVPFSDTVANMLADYLYFRNKIPIPHSKHRHFFVRPDGHRLNEGLVGEWFKQCLNKAGITIIGRFHGPRIHDLRHTFAVDSLYHMVKSGTDIYVALPILSTYLGHRSLAATNGYVRLTMNMFPGLIKETDLQFLDVFPKFTTYETY